MRIWTVIILALLGPALTAEAQPIYYHWITDTEVWLRRTLDEQTYVRATLDTAQTQDPWTLVKPDNLDEAAWLVALSRDSLRTDADPDSVWRQALESLRAPLKNTAWAEPWHPDIDLYVIDQDDNTVHVNIRTTDKAERLTFTRQERLWITSNTIDNLAELFGFTALNNPALPTLFPGAPQTPPGDETAWTKLWSAWIDNFTPGTSRFRPYYADAPKRLQWVWQERLSRDAWTARRPKKRKMAQPLPLASLTRESDGGLSLLVWVLIIAGGGGILGFVTWTTYRWLRSRRASQQRPEQDFDLLELDHFGEALTSLNEAWKQIEPHKQAIGAMLRGGQENVEETLAVGKRMYSYHSQYAHQKTADTAPTWYPREKEEPHAWVSRLFQEIESLERQLHIAKGNVELERAASKTGRARLQEQETRMQEKMQVIRKLEADKMHLEPYKQYIKKIESLNPLIARYQQGQRNFLDKHQNAGTGAVLSFVIHHTLTQLCLAYATNDSKRVGMMYLNLHTIARKLRRYEGTPLPGFQGAIDELQKHMQSMEAYAAGLNPSPNTHPDKKLFQTLLKHLRDHALINLVPFYYDLDDDGRVHGFE